MQIGPSISERQYGFRAGRSILDSVERVVSSVRSVTFRGESGAGCIVIYSECV